MASQRFVDALSPFPDVPTADVPKFSLSRLSSGDSTYAHEIFETYRTTGFFLLEIEERIEYAQNASKVKVAGCVISILKNR